MALSRQKAKNADTSHPISEEAEENSSKILLLLLLFFLLWIENAAMAAYFISLA